jgi:putative endonuclease
MEQFYVYILFSATLNRYYIGYTGQLSDRLFRHTNSGSKSTKATNDWVLAYSETYPTRGEAIKTRASHQKAKKQKIHRSINSNAASHVI